MLLSRWNRQSLKYHPDKNKEKNAQSKFEEISNGMISTRLLWIDAFGRVWTWGLGFLFTLCYSSVSLEF